MEKSCETFQFTTHVKCETIATLVVPVGITMLLSTYCSFLTRFLTCRILVNVVRPAEMTDALEEGLTYAFL